MASCKLLATIFFVIVGSIKFPNFFSRKVVKRWSEKIVSLLGFVWVGILSGWAANYYYHNIYLFDQDKTILFRIESGNFASLREDVEKLNALLEKIRKGKKVNLHGRKPVEVHLIVNTFLEMPFLYYVKQKILFIEIQRFRQK